MIRRNSKGQEEIVGFVVIVVIISVALLILLGFMFRDSNEEALESYEVENFIQSALQYTTDCEDYMEFLSIQELIIACEEERTCINDIESCELLEDTLTNLIENGWTINEQSVIKGYQFKIIVEEQEKLSLREGNETGNYKGSFQDFAKQGIDYEVSFNVYY